MGVGVVMGPRYGPHVIDIARSRGIDLHDILVG
jgi:hypothetical protein